MALYGGLRSTHRLSATALIHESKRMMHGVFTPVSGTTTINTSMRNVESVIMTFVSIPSSAHNENHYRTSTNGAVTMVHLAMAASASAISFVTATASWSRMSYMIIGSEEQPDPS